MVHHVGAWSGGSRLDEWQLALVEQDRVAQHADFIQEITVVCLDAREPVHEPEVQKEHLVVEEADLELLGWRLADLLSVRTQVSVELITVN